MAQGLLEEPIPEDIQNELLSEDEAQTLVKVDEANPDPETGKARTTTYLGIPMLRSHSIRLMARKIIKHNYKHQFTSVSNIGSSGSGKTSSTTNLVHELHLLAEKEYNLYYAVRWVGRKELLDFDKFLKSLTHVPTILVFEDISYALEMVSKYEKVRIKEAFTEIRHTMGEVNVICFFHYHYTRGMDKMMRSSKFSIFCSIDHEEKGNLLQIYGYDNKEFFDKLEYRLRGMDEQGWCTIPIDEESGKKYVYHYGRPFNIALSVQNGIFHFFFYANFKTSDKVWCNHCAPKQIGQRINPKEFVDKIAESYGLRHTLSAIRWWAFIKGGKRAIHSKTYQTFKLANRVFAEHPIEGDLPSLLDYIEKISNKHNHRSLEVKEEKAEQIVSDIAYGSIIRQKPKKQNILDEQVALGLESLEAQESIGYPPEKEDEKKKHRKIRKPPEEAEDDEGYDIKESAETTEINDTPNAIEANDEIEDDDDEPSKDDPRWF